MTRKRRRRRSAVIAAYLITGAIVLQLGPFCSLVANTGVAAFDFSTLIDENGKLFGLFQVCNTTGVVSTTTGDTVTTSSGLLTDCPIIAGTSTGG